MAELRTAVNVIDVIMFVMPKKARILIAQLLLGMMLFTQFVLAVQACTSPTASSSSAFSIGNMPDGCERMAQGAKGNACLADCAKFTQTTNPHAAIAIPAFVPTLLAVIPVVSVPVPERDRIVQDDFKAPPRPYSVSCKLLI